MSKSFEKTVERLVARPVQELDRIRPYARRVRGLGALTLAAMLATGCTSWRSAEAPLYTQVEASRCTAKADTLLILLPGVYSNPDEFVREGFVQAVQDARLAVDVARVDAHLNYYERGTFVQRLQQDVVAPAQARGYRSVWIAGISLGGFSGLIYAKERPADLAGVVLLAPYLGEPAVSAEVADAGGLPRWKAPTAAAARTDRQAQQVELWRWLQGYATPSTDRTPLYLGYGRADRFAASNKLLADVLPPPRVFTTEGGHDWAPWRRLWQSALPTLPLPRCAP